MCVMHRPSLSKSLRNSRKLPNFYKELVNFIKHSRCTIKERSTRHTRCKSLPIFFRIAKPPSQSLKNHGSIEDTGNRSLNGPEGCVAAVTVKSVDLLHWGIKQLSHNLDKFFGKSNLLSCLTLDVEHLHAASHRKHPHKNIAGHSETR